MFTSIDSTLLLEAIVASKTCQELMVEIPQGITEPQVILLGTTAYIMIHDGGSQVDKVEIASIYDQLRSSSIAGLDLATAPGSTGNAGPFLISQPSVMQGFKIMDISGHVVFSASPIKFSPIPSTDMMAEDFRAIPRPGVIWMDKPESVLPPLEYDTAATMLLTEESLVTSGNLSKLHIFSRFPKEIQGKIWIEAADNCAPRIIVANEVSHHQSLALLQA